MATKSATPGYVPPMQLVRALADRFSASILPGEVPGFGTAECEDAARFALGAALERKDGEPGIAVESVAGKDGRRFLRIVAVNDDMPFLVDSIAATVAAHGLVIDRLVHPVIGTRRAAEGRLTAIGEDLAQRESVVYLETERADARVRRVLQAALRTTLADVRAAVTDWPRLRKAMADDAAVLADSEGAELLRWLANDNLTQLGHVTRRRDGSQAHVLGVCRKSARDILAPASWERAFAWFDTSRRRGAQHRLAPLAVKANRLSNVHRRVPLDLFIVPHIEDGAVTALSAHAGIWTSAALATPPAEIPRMRTQLTSLMDKFGFAPNGHAGKALVHALTTLPHDLLIGFGEADLERIATTMMGLVDRPRPRLALVRAPLARHLFAFVWLPRDTLSTVVRKQIQAMLEEACKAPAMDWALSVEGNDLALIRYVLDIRDGDAAPDEAVLDARLQALVRGWRQAVETELAAGEDEHGGAGRAAALAARYADAFPLEYRTRAGAGAAARDIRALRGLGADPGHRRTARLEDGGADALRLKLYQREGAIVLSDAVPVLENFGFRVLEEIPTALDGGRLGYVHDFAVEAPAGTDPADLIDRAAGIEASLSAVLNGLAEDDPFNRLIVATGLSAQEANWLRAWYRYLRQAGSGYGIATVVDALKAAPEVARALVEAFRVAHDPDFSGDRASAVEAASARIGEGLAQVSAINDDRLLRGFRALVAAILRTNAFAPAGAEALAFKIDSALIPGLPKPVPWREVFVYSPRVEGIHLRAGPVARGGLRWSDRRDDFRTEVLGLMKAQRVKNAVIVPTGAKGGFYPKLLPDPVRDRDGWLAEGRSSYQVFIRSLLSITDNIVAGNVVHPARVVVRDGDDPYFVVAADKGTATFSDTANAIAEERDFWLDDAFASGGSNGYDHKAMGITARGAWISVQRHFLEMGVDVQADPVRVAGCGDMSGDVFGNGMLLSKAIRLVAAFDHRHVFLDPDPDPAKSWEERARLFALPRSSWAEYDAKLLSKGGGVFARTLKQIPLSPQVKAMLDLEGDSCDPDTLIRAILKARVDLVWFGGIGTYIKGSGENNAAVGDPANDALRIDGREVRAAVIGEGANLGVTQAGRIEFALGGADGRGGRINTDFIDNSAGVDCSDNEVNIKIALASARRDGRLAENARVRLLAQMTDEVAELVLEDNRRQALALSIASAPGARATASYSRLVDMLEESGNLDRRTEGLADAETWRRRAIDGAGLTRPELAVVLSSAKLVLQHELETSRLPDDPGLADDLVAAFPAPMRKKFRKDILGHRLRREIIATKLANRMINRMGVIHPFELVEEEGTTLAQVAAAFVAAERLFGMAETWRAIDEAAMPEAARLLLYDKAAAALRSHMADLIRAGHASTPPSQLVAELSSGIAVLASETGTLLNAEARAQSALTAATLAGAGAPEAVVGKIVHLLELDGAVGLARLAADSRTDPVALTRAFSELGRVLGLDWAQQAALALNPSDPWERLLVAGLARDFQQMRLDFLARSRKAGPEPFVERWIESHDTSIRQFRGLVSRAQASPPVSPAVLAQVASQARNVLGR